MGTVNASQETVIYHMAKHLSKNNDVTLITGKSRGNPLLKRIEDAEFEVVTVPFWRRKSTPHRLLSWLLKRSANWKIESFSFYIGVILRSGVKRKIMESDLIYTHTRLESRLFSNLAYKFGVPCVSSLQYAGFEKKFFEIDKSIMYLANSKFSKETLEGELNIKIEGVITPGISSEFFDKDKPIIPDIKDCKSLLFVGNLRRQKGIFELIDIFKEISERHKDSKLFIMGSGDLKEALIKKIQDLGLSDRVELVGEVAYEDMPSYYRSATILIHPTHEETFGMVVLEAMACGLPVIASDLPALREVTEGTAHLLPLDDLTLWVERIDYLLNNDQERRESAEKGIEEAKKHLWERKAEQLERFLEKAARHKGKL